MKLDIEEVIKSRKSERNRQCNDQEKRMQGQTMIYNTTQTPTD